MGSSPSATESGKQLSAATPRSLEDRSQSFDSPQQMAATALLMASKTVTPKESSSGPLKKRKKMDIHRSRSGSPCYVSPMSGKYHSQSASESSSRASSYDSKDGEALHESAKVTDTKDIGATASDVVVDDFPVHLHKVLSDPEMGKVIQWLPHGKSWRIVRFDALRKQLIPSHFPELCDKGDGSIDAFLQQLFTWGFEEVVDGPDVGSYSNLVSLDA